MQLEVEKILSGISVDSYLGPSPRPKAPLLGGEGPGNKASISGTPTTYCQLNLKCLKGTPISTHQGTEVGKGRSRGSGQ